MIHKTGFHHHLVVELSFVQLLTLRLPLSLLRLVLFPFYSALFSIFQEASDAEPPGSSTCYSTTFLDFF